MIATNEDLVDDILGLSVAIDSHSTVGEVEPSQEFAANEEPAAPWIRTSLTTLANDHLAANKGCHEQMELELVGHSYGVSFPCYCPRCSQRSY